MRAGGACMKGILANKYARVKFFNSFEKGEDDCWDWLGPRELFNWANEHYNPRRVIWEYLIGGVPPKKHITRLCGNELCINPAHMKVSWRKQVTERNILQKLLAIRAKETWELYLKEHLNGQTIQGRSEVQHKKIVAVAREHHAASEPGQDECGNSGTVGYYAADSIERAKFANWQRESRNTYSGHGRGDSRHRETHSRVRAESLRILRKNY